MTDDFDVDPELGFEPAVSATGAEPRTERAPRQSRLRRAPRTARKSRSVTQRAAAGVGLFAALGTMGVLYASLATSGTAGAATDQVAMGKQLYEVSCITCHGANLDGVEDHGPSLIGTGGAATYFQVGTGRMPANGQDASEPRKTAKYDDEQTRALAAYVQAMGGGPAVPSGELQSGDATIAEGGELFRVNCASCHGTTFKGAPLSAGKVAPSLNASTDLQMWTAMLSGPESMPVFSNNTITTEQKKAIVAYVQTIKASNDPGGSGIDRIGPVSEAIVIWVAGVGVLMVAILWIGAKSQ